MKVIVSAVALVFVALFAASGFSQSYPSGFCVIPTAGNQSVNLGLIQPAEYDALLVGGEAAEVNVTVRFSWCSFDINSTTCQANNTALTITSMDQIGPNCVVNFNTIYEAPTAVNNTVSLTLWSEDDGDTGAVTVFCDPNGAIGKAKLLGHILNPAVYSYTFFFSSIHACASS
jgi:hypothetical protein